MAEPVSTSAAVGGTATAAGAGSAAAVSGGSATASGGTAATTAGGASATGGATASSSGSASASSASSATSPSTGGAGSTGSGAATKASYSLNDPNDARGTQRFDPNTNVSNVDFFADEAQRSGAPTDPESQGTHAAQSPASAPEAEQGSTTGPQQPERATADAPGPQDQGADTQGGDPPPGQQEAAQATEPRNNERDTVGQQIGGAVNDAAKEINKVLGDLRKAIEDDVEDKGGLGRVIAATVAATVIDLASSSVEDAGEAAEQLGSLGKSVGEKGIDGLGEELDRLRVIAEKGLDLATRGATKHLRRLKKGAKQVERAKKTTRAADAAKSGKRQSQRAEYTHSSTQQMRAQSPRPSKRPPVKPSKTAQEVAQHAKRRAKALKKSSPELFKGKRKSEGGKLVHEELAKDFERGRGPYKDVPGIAEHEYGLSYKGKKGKSTARTADVILDADGRRVVIEYKARVVHNPQTGQLKTFGYNRETGRMEVHRTNQIADYEVGGDVLGKADSVDVYVTSYETGSLYKFDPSLGWLRIE